MPGFSFMARFESRNGLIRPVPIFARSVSVARILFWLSCAIAVGLAFWQYEHVLALMQGLAPEA